MSALIEITYYKLQRIVARTNFVGLTNSLIPKQYPLAHCAQQRYFGALSSVINSWNNVGSIELKAILSQTRVENVIPPSVLPVTIPIRTVTKFTLQKGKRRTVKTVIKRFYRLNWGMWIRTCAGRRSKVWRKSSNRRRRQKRHVFCNATQCTLLDKMVTKYWKRPHYYVDDPYAPYHKRNEFPITRRIPQP